MRYVYAGHLGGIREDTPHPAPERFRADDGPLRHRPSEIRHVAEQHRRCSDRQMRKSLMDTFDKIYILDLHGNARKKETCADGSKDENVFDIMQGVSINIFVKLPE